MSQSFWFEAVPEQKRCEALVDETQADLVVVGAGMAGLHAAYEAAERGVSVVVLEQNHVASGDSSATTGFLTRVPDCALESIVERQGGEFLQAVLVGARAAQHDLFDLIKSERIACDLKACSSKIISYRAEDPELEREWTWLSRGADVGRLAAGEVGGLQYAQAIEVRNEAQFHSRKFLSGLLDALLRRGVRVFEESPVESVVSIADGVVVKMASGSVRAKAVVLAVGDASGLFSELQPLVEPRLSYVVVARYDRPIFSNDLVWDTEHPYQYMRRVGDRELMLGGWDVPASKTRAKFPDEEMSAWLREHVSGSFEITHAWSGSLFETADGLPYVFEHPQQPGVFVATGFSGNGLVFGSWMGRLAARKALGVQDPAHARFALSRTGARLGAVAPISSPALGAGESFVRVVKAEDVIAGRPHCAKAGDRAIALFRVGERVYALDNRCTHAGGSLCQGAVEETIVQCPMHGAQFDVTTGEVKGPPAFRPVQAYETRMVDGWVEVRLREKAAPAASTSSAPRAPAADPGRTLRTPVFLAILVLWVLELLWQLYVEGTEPWGLALLRSYAFTGATVIGLALSASTLFKWRPRLAAYWRVRRYLGVGGFVAIVLHVLTVYNVIYDWQILSVYQPLNPLLNPVVFGSFAFPIFLAMALTSSDRALTWMGSRNWKRLHRLVYIGYPLAILHFAFVSPSAIKTAPGVLLIAVTVFAVFGQIFWWLRTIARKKFKTPATVVGAGIVLVFGILFWLMAR